MSARPRRGSAAFVVVLGATTAILVGGFILTFVTYPVTNAFTDAAFWSASTTPGANLVAAVSGIWTFWGAPVLIAILAYVWINTRQ